MFRLFVMWAVLTAVLFGFYYFVERVQKKETAKWTSRAAWCGTVTALILCGIIFLERL